MALLTVVAVTGGGGEQLGLPQSSASVVQASGYGDFPGKQSLC